MHACWDGSNRVGGNLELLWELLQAGTAVIELVEESPYDITYQG